MSKHKTSQKKLIIEDVLRCYICKCDPFIYNMLDNPKDDDEVLNPFSFKEFIRSQKQPFYTTGETEKTSVGAGLADDDDYECPEDFYHHSHKGNFFTDPSLLVHSFQDEFENERTKSFQISAFEKPLELGLPKMLHSRAYLDQSVLSSEETDETVDDWEDAFSPKASFHRRSTGSYEGDEELSVMDLTFHTKKSSIENGIRDQQKLREENAQLRKHIRELTKKSKADSTTIKQLSDELYNQKLQEERDSKALETMVQSVEENLQLMTKRAVKAESSLSKVKQDVQQLQSQLEKCKCENEQLRVGETAALNTMRHNAQMASEYLHRAAHDAETSIKQLLTGRETLCLVSELLRSIDKIAEVQK